METWRACILACTARAKGAGWRSAGQGTGSPDHGRPSWPPSLMSGILLLPYFEEVSDEEAVARLCFDLRWKVALQLPLAFVPPHPRPSVSRASSC